MSDREQHIRDATEGNLPPATNKPCDECPWRRGSVAGHLGPHTAREWAEMAHSETPIMCHKTLRHSEHRWTDEEIRQCRGAAIFRANVGKLPRNPSAVVGPRDTQAVFSWDDEFMTHHGEDPDTVDGLAPWRASPRRAPRRRYPGSGGEVP